MYVVVSGGGGDSRTGVKNAIFISKFDFESDYLSPPVEELRTEGDLPYRMAVHPNGDGMVCSFPESCRCFEWEISRTSKPEHLAMRPSDKLVGKLEDVGQQKALTFNLEGSMLASGGEDGHLRILRWPSAEIVFEKADAHESVKDLDFSSDGKFLASLGDSGPCRVWDLKSSTIITSFAAEKGETFGFCRFSRGVEDLLYIAAKKGQNGYIMTWKVGSTQRVSEKLIIKSPISALNISPDGKLLAVGTPDGDVSIFESHSLNLIKTVKEAHLVFVTTLEFSHDSRALVSASGDSSARVTIVDDGKSGVNYIFVFLVITILILLALIKKVETS